MEIGIGFAPTKHLKEEWIIHIPIQSTDGIHHSYSHSKHKPFLIKHNCKLFLTLLIENKKKFYVVVYRPLDDIIDVSNLYITNNSSVKAMHFLSM